MQTIAAMDQKAAFQERLKRINAGKQFEHEDVVGYRTQTAYNRRAATKAKKPRRTLGDRIMVLVAFAAGLSSVLLGRMIYFHAASIQGLPDAFYDLGGRGMILGALVVAGILSMALHLTVKGRLPALVLGCLAMQFGEASAAARAPELWTQLFSAEYAAEKAAEAPKFALNAAS